MPVIDQKITDHYAIYNGDACDVLPALPDSSVHMSIYSPPFAVDGGRGCLYAYSSSERDLSNCLNYEEFFEWYEFIVEQMARVIMPGRLTCVHCMDVPKDGANICGYSDFPGDIIKLHQKYGFDYSPRICIWKEPLGVRNRTMLKSLAHRTTVDDCTLVSVASADYLLQFRRRGNNPIPVKHPRGFMRYIGTRKVPHDLLRLRGFSGDQKLNRYSHWIWRQYASAFWGDIDEGRIIPYAEAEETDDERHPHPLQLDVIERAVEMWTNPGETVLSPFMGVGSEVYGAVINGRHGIGVELKTAYYKQALKNVAAAVEYAAQKQCDLFSMATEESASARCH